MLGWEAAHVWPDLREDQLGGALVDAGDRVQDLELTGERAGQLLDLLRQLIEMPLVWAVPGVADLRDRSLPRGLDPRVVARSLGSCDRRRTVGRRDYAIVLLLVRLGLRAAEVAAIQLEDLDWRRGEILIRGKRNRHDVLPLPASAPASSASRPTLRSCGRDR